MPSSLVHRQAPRRGAVLVWLVVSLGVIIIVVALGTDGGRMMEERRRVQAAADAAALAGAADLYTNNPTNRGTDPTGSAARAALKTAADNGYSNDGTTNTVTVNIPPTTGPFAGQKDYVEVVIQSHLQGTFSAAFTSSDLPVKGRSVARGRPLPLGLTVLRRYGAGALSVSGNGSVFVNGGPIIVNSKDGAALITSSNGTVSSTSNVIAGGYQGSPSSISGPIFTGVDPQPDPMRSFPAPDPSASPLQSTSRTSVQSGTTHLQPGVYRGGINISGNGTVQLSPGIYILDGGGLQVSDNGSLTGDGVMIYNTGRSWVDGSPVVADSGGGISITGNGNVTLSAPTGGPYRGVSIFQARTSTQTMTLAGNGNVQITGVVYAASAAVQLSGNAGSTDNTLGGAFVCNTLRVSSNGNFNVNLGKKRPWVPDVRLVE